MRTLGDCLYCYDLDRDIANYLIDPTTEIVNGLTRREHLTLMILAQLVEPPGLCRLSQKILGDFARMEKSDVSKVLYSLEKRFIIFRAKDGIHFTTSFLKAVYGIK